MFKVFFKKGIKEKSYTVFDLQAGCESTSGSVCDFHRTVHSLGEYQFSQTD